MMTVNMAEAPRIDMQLIKNGEDVTLDFIPAVSPGQYSIVRAILLSEYSVPVEAPVFGAGTLNNGREYSALSCSAVRAIAEENEHYFDEKRLASEIWQALTNGGNAAQLITEIIPVERSHRLLDL